jgi:uncharacterized membrane protein
MWMSARTLAWALPALALLGAGGPGPWAAPSKNKPAEPVLWDSPGQSPPAMPAPSPASPPARPAPAAERFMVQGVDNGDTLNIRARPDSRSTLVGTIPPDAHGVRATGRRQQIGPSQWWEVSYEGHRGWVNARFLVPDPAPAPTAPARPAPPPARPPSPAAASAPMPAAPAAPPPAAAAPAAPAPAAAAAQQEPALPPPPPTKEPRTAAVEPRPALSADPYASGEIGPRPQDDLVCFLNEPLWKIELRKDGSATCTETCDGPPGLRVAVTQPISVKGRGAGWNMKIQKPNGSPFMSLSVRRTDQCTEDMSHRVFGYEISARRGNGKQYKGCCNPVAPARP